MPLNTVSSPLELSSYEGINDNFVIFYASRDESGRMWCPVRWFSSLTASRVTATPPTRGGSGGEKREAKGLGCKMRAVLEPVWCYQIIFIFRIRIPGHSFLFWLSRSSHDASLDHPLDIATLHPLP